MKRKGFSIFFCVLLITSTTLCVFAAGSYTSTYDMTGGVFSKWIQPKSKCEITVNPTKGTAGQDMGIIWAHETWLGWDGSQKFVSSTTGGTVSFKSSNKRKVWLRNYTGNQWTGNVTFSWD